MRAYSCGSQVVPITIHEYKYIEVINIEGVFKCTDPSIGSKVRLVSTGRGRSPIYYSQSITGVIELELAIGWENYKFTKTDEKVIFDIVKL